MSTPEEVQEPKSKVPPMPPKQADSAATAERPYVVLKRGLFWRPKDRGYTYNIAEAGRYTREEAEARCHPDNEPVTMELASKYESVPTLADRELAEAICRELFPEFCTGLSDDLCEFANRATVVSKHIAAHCAAATAKERQARELAEGEMAAAELSFLTNLVWIQGVLKKIVQDVTNSDFDADELLDYCTAQITVINGKQKLAPAPAGKTGGAALRVGRLFQTDQEIGKDYRIDEGLLEDMEAKAATMKAAGKDVHVKEVL